MGRELSNRKPRTAAIAGALNQTVIVRIQTFAPGCTCDLNHDWP
jgi:hypothetical protein